MDFNIEPYHDDLNESKKFTRILFRPGYNVQTRELNQLQSLLQKQIERFGDNIFARGTIVDGCNFRFYPSYSYVKIEDREVDGTTAAPINYINYYLKSETTGLTAHVLDYKDGFESSDPDLKTLYLQYLNSGDNSTTNVFIAGDTLKIQDFNSSVHKVLINNGGLGFSNSDSVIVTPAVAVNVSSGTFTNGEYITNGTANLQIIGIDANSLATSGQIILSLKPRDADLANATATSTKWTVSNTESIHNISNTVTATITQVIGSALDVNILTNGSGKITSADVVARGTYYTVAPTVRIKSANNTSGLSVLDLTAQNYLTKVTVASTANAVGNGYGFGVSAGVIYAKGYFLKVDEQTIVVEKYNTSPNNVVVVFDTTEEIITENDDTSLLDNAYTTDNELAPGAHRVRMTPTLTVLNKSDADANPEYFSLCEWSEGNPYKQKQYTSYNKINDEMARRTDDIAGNFSIDKFLITTKSPMSPSSEGQYCSIVVDPGKAYIKGYRVETLRNYVTDIEKGTDTKLSNNQTISLGYGNYVVVNNVGGTFQFNSGSSVDLYDSAKQFLSDITLIKAGNTAPVGTKIGTANIRSFVPKDDDQGSYKLYLFNVRMNTGKNFRDARSIYHNGTRKGICDIVTALDATTNANVASIYAPSSSKLLFYSGAYSLKNANNVTYRYRTIDQTVNIANTGLLVKDISATIDEFFPYTANLTTTQLTNIIVIPTVNCLFTNTITGTLNISSGSNTVTGTGTVFTTDLQVGDYLYLFSNGSTSDMKKVVSIINNTSLSFDFTATFTNTVSVAYRAFPYNVPIPLGYRNGLSANVNSNNNILTINFGSRFQGSTSANCSLAVDIERRNITQQTKTPVRNRFVKICVANNAGGTAGPWCLGVPDIFRLRNVYISNTSTVNTASDNATSQFAVDHNQTPDYLDLGWLTLKPKALNVINANTYMLVEFDYFTSSGVGFFDTVSYVSANLTQRMLVDSQPLSNLTSTINSFEIPEIHAQDGTNYDLISFFDFRPSAANTVAPDANSAAAPLNPANTLSFGNTADPTRDLKFPVPASDFTCTLEEFVGRKDSVMVSKEGRIFVASGIPNNDPSKQLAPAIPDNCMNISDIVVPPYPNLPISKSYIMSEILRTNTFNEQYLRMRPQLHTITRTYDVGSRVSQPARFTMADVAKLKKRIEDLEYYQRISLLESDIKNRIIPSSVDPTLDRFKLGFFVDDYHDYTLCDRDNPQFAAFVENNALVPEKMLWQIPFERTIGTQPYVDFLVVNQEFATVAIDSTEPPCLPNANTANTYAYRAQSYVREVGNTVSSYIDTYNITMAASDSGSTTLFFYAYDKNIKIEVYKGDTMIANTASAASLTDAEKVLVVSNEVSNWFADNANTYLQNSVVTGNYAKYTGKLTWTHIPTSGRNYTVKVYKGDGSYRWKWLMQYPIDRSTVGCPTVPSNNPTPPDPLLPGEVDDWVEIEVHYCGETTSYMLNRKTGEHIGENERLRARQGDQDHESS